MDAPEPPNQGRASDASNELHNPETDSQNPPSMYVFAIGKRIMRPNNLGINNSKNLLFDPLNELGT